MNVPIKAIGDKVAHLKTGSRSVVVIDQDTDKVGINFMNILLRLSPPTHVR